MSTIAVTVDWDTKLMKYPKKFFQIEKMRRDLKIGMFNGDLNDLIKIREANRKQSRPLNYGLPYYPEEKDLVTKMYLEKNSLGEVIDYFQRPESSIVRILGTLGTLHAKELKKVKKVSRASLFIESILNGTDPITGEELDNQSPWKHPRITSDIKKYFDDKTFVEADKKKKKSKGNKVWSFLDIKDWVKANYNEVDIVVIQQGYYFAALDEDAALCAEEFGLEPFRVYGSSVLQAGFPVTAIEKYIDLFRERNFKYVVVEQTGDIHANGRMVRRIAFPEVPAEERVF